MDMLLTPVLFKKTTVIYPVNCFPIERELKPFAPTRITWVMRVLLLGLHFGNAGNFFSG
jgi:hypothetical protein